jgi:nicotinamidase-related amidase
MLCSSNQLLPRENSMNKQALIVIDIQNDYFPGGKWTQVDMDAAADNAAALIAEFRRSGQPVVHIRHEFRSADAPFFVPGSEGAAIHPKVAPQEGEPVLLKHEINSFIDTGLKEILDSHGIKDVVIAGAMSHMCVDGCTRAARDFGYNVTVAHDACASRDLEFNGVKVPAAQVHAAFMAALGFAYAKMQSSADIIAASRA